jgi:hypothetical protein
MAMKDSDGNILQYLPIKDAEEENLRFVTAENRLEWEGGYEEDEPC